MAMDALKAQDRHQWPAYRLSERFQAVWGMPCFGHPALARGAPHKVDFFQHYARAYWSTRY